MKKIVCLSFIMIGLTLGANAQTEARLKSISDSIAQLYERYFKLSEASDVTQKNLTSTVTNLENKYKAVENQSQANAEKLNKFVEDDKVNAKTMYEKSKLSFINTATFMESVDNGLKDLNSAISSFAYAANITKLNNPTNNELGFSLDKAVIKIVEEKILSANKGGKKFGEKLKDIIRGVVNFPLISPIVNNPLTQSIVNSFSNSTVPAVSSISSVYNIITGLAVNESSISSESLKNFTVELQKYVQHYEALAKASTSLETNLTSLRLKIESVRKIAQNFTQQSIIDVYTADGLPDLSKMTLSEMTKKYFNYRSVNEYIGGLEGNSNKNYNYLSRRLVFPILGRNKASFIMEELDKLHNEYLATLQSYHENVLGVLNNATQLSEDPKAILTKTNELQTQFEQVHKTYTEDIDINTIKGLESNIPRH